MLSDAHAYRTSYADEVKTHFAGRAWGKTFPTTNLGDGSLISREFRNLEQHPKPQPQRRYRCGGWHPRVRTWPFGQERGEAPLILGSLLNLWEISGKS